MDPIKFFTDPVKAGITGVKEFIFALLSPDSNVSSNRFFLGMVVVDFLYVINKSAAEGGWHIPDVPNGWLLLITTFVTGAATQKGIDAYKHVKAPKSETTEDVPEEPNPA